MSIRTVDYGQTGLKVSSIGLGGAQYVYGSKAERTSIIDLIKHAYKMGITVFDTAPMYESEDIFGDALKDFDRSSYVLVAKIGRYPNMIFDYSAKKVEESVKNSLELLKTSYVDIIKIHDFEYAGDKAVDLIVSETLPMLQKLKDQGLVRHIGIGSYHLAKTKQVIERSPVKVESILNHSCLTLIDQELRDYLPFFRERGIGIMNASPLAHGLLMQKPIPDWVKASDDLKQASREAVRLTQEANMSIEKLAYHYCASESYKAGIEVFLTGAGSIGRLETNIGIILNDLSKDEWNMVERLRRDVFSKLPQNDRNWVNRSVDDYLSAQGNK